MAGPSARRVAQVCIGILLLVIIRSLGEYFRLQYVCENALLIGQVTPHVAGALAGVTLALALTCYLAGHYRAAIVTVMATVVSLCIYKVAVTG